MKKPSKKVPKNVVNRRARFDYALGDETVAGLVLSGPEVRAARDNRVNLAGTFVTIRQNELWLNNASFVTNQKDEAIDTSPRKLLVKRKEIDKLQDAKQLGMTIVPTKLLTNGRFIKLVIAIAKGKKNYDKRQTLKARDQQREAARMMKNY